jgi:hypothetical protein
VLSEPPSRATQGFLQLTSAVVFGTDPMLQHRMLERAFDAKVLSSWCDVGATLCQTALTELVTATGQTGEMWLKSLDNGSGPMACAQLLACAPDSPASRSLSAAIRRDALLQSEVVIALAELCGQLVEHLANANHVDVRQVLHGVAETFDPSI